MLIFERWNKNFKNLYKRKEISLKNRKRKERNMGKLFMRLGGWTLKQIWDKYKGPGQNVENVMAVVKEHAIYREGEKENTRYLFCDGVAKIQPSGQTSISLNDE